MKTFMFLSVLLMALSGSAQLCEDKKGKFSTKNWKGKAMKRNCKWVQQNLKWRCNNAPNAKEHCPKSCDSCSTPSPTSLAPTGTPSISSAPTSTPSISSAPTSKYNFCQDVSNKFKVDSIKWLRGKKNCK